MALRIRPVFMPSLSVLTADQKRFLRSLDTVCGTPAGWLRHRRRHEDPCRPCVLAWDRQPGLNPVQRPVCGTSDGWRAHRRRSEHPCPACQAAQDQADAGKCGTYAGWMVHRHRGTLPCDPCTDAEHDYKGSRPRKSRARP